MENNSRVGESAKRLEQMKQATILNCLADIDLDSDLDLYDTMIHIFTEGKIDDAFYSPMFKDMDMPLKRELLDKGKKYLPLCFFGGSPDYWVDSIEGSSFEDPDLICGKILDNYNFILEVIKDYGEDILELLNRIQKTKMFSSNVLIDYLRNVFDDDDLLKEVLLEMTKKDGDYSDFTDSQKAILFMYPEGILFEENEDGDKKGRISVLELNNKINDYTDFYVDFEDIISNIFIDYRLDSKETIHI